MSRSIWKPVYNLLDKRGDCMSYFAHCVRRCRVLPEHINLTIPIYNGFKNVNVSIGANMLGVKFGQLSLTKKHVIHQMKKKKKK